MKNMCVKVSDELYEKVKSREDSLGISLSEFMRESLMKVTCDAHENHSKELAILHEQLERNSMYLEQANDARTRADAIIMNLTQQLDRTQLQLEDMRNRRTIWQRLRAVFVTESV